LLERHDQATDGDGGSARRASRRLDRLIDLSRDAAEIGACEIRRQANLAFHVVPVELSSDGRFPDGRDVAQ